MAARVAAIAIALALCSSIVGVSALQCNAMDIEAPTDVTLMASPKAPETQAIILYPDCTYKELVVDDEGTFSNAYLSFDRLASVPSSSKTIFIGLSGSGAASGIDLSGATGTTRLDIDGFSATAFEKIKFPPSLRTLVAEYSKVLPSFANAVLPSTLTEMSFRLTNLSVLPRLPPNLTSLDFFKSYFSTIDFEYPSSVKSLNFDNNYLMELGPATLPPALTYFSSRDNANKRIRGIAWPQTLQTVFIGVWADSEIELRQSDVDFFDTLNVTPFSNKFLPGGVVTNTNCSDETATLYRLFSANVCVITDERFEALYGKPTTPPPSGPSENNSGSASGPSSDNDQSRTPSTTSRSPGAEERGDNEGDSTSGAESQPSKQPVDMSKSPKSERTTRPPASGASSDDTNQTTESTTVSPTIIAVALILSITVAVALAVIGYRVLIVSKHHDDKTYHGMESPSNNLTESGASMSDDASLDSAFLNDSGMLLFHIEFAEVEIGAVLARSLLFETLYGEYNAKSVVLRRLRAEVEDEAFETQFVDAIRLRSTLDHPKIVAFVGATWSQQHGVMMVTEYMEGGDLATLLAKQPVPPSPQDWFQPWTATKKMKSKALIARDVAEVLVYLHSYKTPILHRNVKTSNVMLDSQGNAKLCSVGINRDMSAEAIMTYEAGAIAWIAPEVLRGDQYSEKADIYALGVLLVELDRCRSPYEDNRANAHIAAAVVSGQLRPSAAEESPAALKELVAKCVSYHEADRPTAMEVNFALRKMISERTVADK